jgi:hypothetical protein
MKLTKIQEWLMTEARAAGGPVRATTHRHVAAAEALVRKGLLEKGPYYDMFQLPGARS